MKKQIKESESKISLLKQDLEMENTLLEEQTEEIKRLNTRLQ